MVEVPPVQGDPESRKSPWRRMNDSFYSILVTEIHGQWGPNNQSIKFTKVEQYLVTGIPLTLLPAESKTLQGVTHEHKAKQLASTSKMLNVNLQLLMWAIWVKRSPTIALWIQSSQGACLKYLPYTCPHLIHNPSTTISAPSKELIVTHQEGRWDSGNKITTQNPSSFDSMYGCIATKKQTHPTPS